MASRLPSSGFLVTRDRARATPASCALAPGARASATPAAISHTATTTGIDQVRLMPSPPYLKRATLERSAKNSILPPGETFVAQAFRACEEIVNRRDRGEENAKNSRRALRAVKRRIFPHAPQACERWAEAPRHENRR